MDSLASQFAEDAERAPFECLRVLDRWHSLQELKDHGPLVGIAILARISERMTEEHAEMNNKAFHRFLRSSCNDELKILRERAENLRDVLRELDVDSLAAGERDERVRSYDNMDFCDDFEDYCKFYGLPFHEFGEVYGGKLLHDYVEILKSLESKV